MTPHKWIGNPESSTLRCRILSAKDLLDHAAKILATLSRSFTVSQPVSHVRKLDEPDCGRRIAQNFLLFSQRNRAIIPVGNLKDAPRWPKSLTYCRERWR